MSGIDVAKLENVRHRAGKVVARCPACAAAGQDRTRDHLVVFESGKFTCVAHPGDSDHRREIWRLVGSGPVAAVSWTLEKPAEGGVRTLRTLQNLLRYVESEGPKPSAVHGVPQYSTAFVPPQVENDPSGASEHYKILLDTALTLFQGQVAAELSPDSRIPGEFLDVVAEWAGQHPRWVKHPQVKGCLARNRLLGWTRHGKAVCGHYTPAPLYPEPPQRDHAQERQHTLAAAQRLLQVRDAKGKPAATPSQINTVIQLLQQYREDAEAIALVAQLEAALPDAQRCSARLKSCRSMKHYEALLPVAS